ncbi:MAG: antibiotic biosynthesis monooxygenase [Phenylobacterium sp.]|uniref:putative quinol monooxygenase n=1 Tax=Phenylobacterium sp. TaxID=1871053 RepID=UPI001A4746DA|nr:putative quinol monooxygenase [Phenylobacterium sp.]MBL8773551.1 antibiotic biosynthesis monooxygenase [Phenylobacterium sp.]
MTVVVIGSMRFPADAMANVRPHLATLVAETRTHDGCVEYNAAEDIGDPGLVRFSEIWPSHDLLTAHLQAPHIAPWRAVAARYGVSDRTFTAFDASNPREV